MALNISPKERDVLHLNIQGCAVTNVGLELYDERGALITQESIPNMQEGDMQIFLPNTLAPGVYFAKFSWSDGQWTERVVVAQ